MMRLLPLGAILVGIGFAGVASAQVPATDPAVALAAAQTAYAAGNASMNATIIGLMSLVVQSITALGLGFMAYKTAALAHGQVATAAKVDEIVVTTGNTQRMSEAVHTLVNSNMGIQLQLTMAALRRLAVVTKDPSDIVAADEAEKLWHDHQAKQASVDTMPNPAPTATGKAEI